MTIFGNCDASITLFDDLFIVLKHLILCSCPGRLLQAWSLPCSYWSSEHKVETFDPVELFVEVSENPDCL